MHFYLHKNFILVKSGCYTVAVDHGNLQCPSQPRDVAHPRYTPASEVSPGGLDGGWSPFRAPVVRHRPPTPVCGTKLRLGVMPVTPNYIPYHLLLLFSSFGATVMYIFTHTHTHTYMYKRILENLCLYTPVPPCPQPQ
jgi:hypothetical protein